jgi:hypothetical protein
VTQRICHLPYQPAHAMHTSTQLCSTCALHAIASQQQTNFTFMFIASRTWRSPASWAREVGATEVFGSPPRQAACCCNSLRCTGARSRGWPSDTAVMCRDDAARACRCSRRRCHASRKGSSCKPPGGLRPTASAYRAAASESMDVGSPCSKGQAGLASTRGETNNHLVSLCR